MISNRKIIHITGVSGSGKSTIADIIKHRFKNVHVVDTDTIDDESFSELYEDNKEFNAMIRTQTGEPYLLHQELNIKKMRSDNLRKS